MADHFWRPSRRQFLARSGAGFGVFALEVLRQWAA